MENKEKIKLEDFINDAIKSFNLYGEDFKMKTKITHVCPECGLEYKSWDDKFCSKDGETLIAKISNQTTKYRNWAIESILINEDGVYQNEEFPYEHVEIVYKNHDGDYYTNYIFKRKLDGKYFVYTLNKSIDNMDEEYFYETDKIVKSIWDFEKRFE
jgi:hypothetical protein